MKNINSFLAFIFGSIILIAVFQEDRNADLDWKLPSKTDGFPDINLNEYEGEVIFINLWAEWCPPCVAEMPSIQNLYVEYKDRVKFVTVVTDYNEATEEYMNETGYCFPVYESHLPQSYGYETFPTTWIIDRKGNIVIKRVGEFKWDSQEVKNLLDTLL